MTLSDASQPSLGGFVVPAGAVSPSRHSRARDACEASLPPTHPPSLRDARRRDEHAYTAGLPARMPKTRHEEHPRPHCEDDDRRSLADSRRRPRRRTASSFFFSGRRVWHLPQHRHQQQQQLRRRRRRLERWMGRGRAASFDCNFSSSSSSNNIHNHNHNVTLLDSAVPLVDGGEARSTYFKQESEARSRPNRPANALGPTGTARARLVKCLRRIVKDGRSRECTRRLTNGSESVAMTGHGRGMDRVGLVWAGRVCAPPADACCAAA